MYAGRCEGRFECMYQVDMYIGKKAINLKFQRVI